MLSFSLLIFIKPEYYSVLAFFILQFLESTHLSYDEFHSLFHDSSIVVLSAFSVQCVAALVAALLRIAGCLGFGGSNY